MSHYSFYNIYVNCLSRVYYIHKENAINFPLPSNLILPVLSTSTWILPESTWILPDHPDVYCRFIQCITYHPWFSHLDFEYTRKVVQAKSYVLYVYFVCISKIWNILLPMHSIRQTFWHVFNNNASVNHWLICSLTNSSISNILILNCCYSRYSYCHWCYRCFVNRHIDFWLLLLFYMPMCFSCDVIHRLV